MTACCVRKTEVNGQNIPLHIRVPLNPVHKLVSGIEMLMRQLTFFFFFNAMGGVKDVPLA